MNPRERGFLLLTGYLGDPERKPLTVAQFRELAKRMQTMEKPVDTRELTQEDLVGIGCSREAAGRILRLLSQEEHLDYYLTEGKRHGCCPVTRITEGYPANLRRRLHLDAPGVLWARGDLSLLGTPAIALVGSRELQEENYAFACEVGKQAALQGYTLVSGNARGADRSAQQSCLNHGGNVISIVADELYKQPEQDNLLYLSKTGFDLEFSAHRALDRNTVIHAFGSHTFVAQCRFGKGGTWDGTKNNLRKGYSPVFCFRDGSAAMAEFAQMGAQLIDIEALQDISVLHSNIRSFL